MLLYSSRVRRRAGVKPAFNTPLLAAHAAANPLPVVAPVPVPPPPVPVVEPVPVALPPVPVPLVEPVPVVPVLPAVPPDPEVGASPMTPVQAIPDTIKVAAMQPRAAGRKAKARMSSSPEWTEPQSTA